MTLKEVQDLTDEALKIKVAELDNWKQKMTKVNHNTSLLLWAKKGEFGARPTKLLPDYPNDLNAMHEAEKLIITPSRYCRQLWENMFGDNGDWDQHRSNYAAHIISATARQRAEAFVLVMN